MLTLSFAFGDFYFLKFSLPSLLDALHLIAKLIVLQSKNHKLSIIFETAGNAVPFCQLSPKAYVIPVGNTDYLIDSSITTGHIALIGVSDSHWRSVIKYSSNDARQTVD